MYKLVLHKQVNITVLLYFYNHNHNLKTVKCTECHSIGRKTNYQSHRGNSDKTNSFYKTLTTYPERKY